MANETKELIKNKIDILDLLDDKDLEDLIKLIRMIKSEKKSMKASFADEVVQQKLTQYIFTIYAIRHYGHNSRKGDLFIYLR